MNNLHGFLHDIFVGGYISWLRQARLQELGMTQIPANYVRVKNLRQLVQPLDESQGPSQSHGPNLWLVCDLSGP